jgi:hypothetical protein
MRDIVEVRGNDGPKTAQESGRPAERRHRIVRAPAVACLKIESGKSPFSRRSPGAAEIVTIAATAPALPSSGRASFSVSLILGWGRVKGRPPTFSHPRRYTGMRLTGGRSETFGRRGGVATAAIRTKRSGQQHET